MKLIQAIFYLALSTSAFATQLEDGVKALELGDYATAYTLLKPLADSGNKEAQHRMAVNIYFSEESGHKDPQLAASTLLKLAESGYVKAQSTAAMGYKIGFFGFPQDDVKYIYWLRKASDGGQTSSVRGLADEYASGFTLKKDPKKAKDLYEIAGSQGDCSAYESLGQMYHYGRGVTVDYRKASNYYDQSIKLGCADAKAYLARMYYFGQGVKVNYAKADQLANEAIASEYGSLTGLELLALMHYKNKSSNKDPVIAGVIVLLQVENNEQKLKDKDYQFESIVFENLTSAQQAEARQLASEWKKGTPLPTTSVTGR